jgi:hypothetical protein
MELAPQRLERRTNRGRHDWPRSRVFVEAWSEKACMSCARAGGSGKPQTTSRTSEKIMSMQHSLAAALWLLTAVGAYILVASWADTAQSGKLHPWVLVIVFWGAAMVSVTIHHLSLYLSKCLAEGPDAFRRYRVHYARAARTIVGSVGSLLPYARPFARTVDAARALRPRAAGRRAVLWGMAAASVATREPRHLLAHAVTALKRHWAEPRPAGGPARPLLTAGGQSVALAAKLGALIGMR